jgi:hypothetical protein
MARFTVPLLLGLALHFSALALAKERDPPFRVNIGYFKFPLNDPEIKDRILQTDRNVTIWEDLYQATLRYWQNNEQPRPDDEEEDAIRQFANDSAINHKELEVLLERAKVDYDTELKAWGNDAQKLWDDNQTDLSEKFLDHIEEEFNILHTQRLAAFAGVGASVDCSVHIDSILDQMSEWEKAGMSVASTLMALLPTFLAFGSL